jgi:hypothetical protein
MIGGPPEGIGRGNIDRVGKSCQAVRPANEWSHTVAGRTGERGFRQCQ